MCLLGMLFALFAANDVRCMYEKYSVGQTGADPEFIERGFISINVCVFVCVCVWRGGGVALLILSVFS